jgi:hypothetical protein
VIRREGNFHGDPFRTFLSDVDCFGSRGVVVIDRKTSVVATPDMKSPSPILRAE